MTRRTALTVGGFLAFVGIAAAAGMEEEIQNYIKKLKSRDASARKEAADGIAKIGQIKASFARPAVQPLIESLADKDARVRAAAASALSKIDAPKEAVPALVRLLKDESEQPVKMAAVTGLGLIGEPAKEAVSALRAIQKDAKSEDEKRLARAAGEAIRQINGVPRKKN